MIPPTAGSSHLQKPEREMVVARGLGEAGTENCHAMAVKFRSPGMQNLLLYICAYVVSSTVLYTFRFVHGVNFVYCGVFLNPTKKRAKWFLVPSFCQDGHVEVSLCLELLKFELVPTA